MKKMKMDDVTYIMVVGGTLVNGGLSLTSYYTHTLHTDITYIHTYIHYNTYITYIHTYIHTIQLHYITLHSITLHYIALHSIT